MQIQTLNICDVGDFSVLLIRKDKRYSVTVTDEAGISIEGYSGHNLPRAKLMFLFISERMKQEKGGGEYAIPSK